MESVHREVVDARQNSLIVELDCRQLLPPGRLPVTSGFFLSTFYATRCKVHNLATNRAL